MGMPVDYFYMATASVGIVCFLWYRSRERKELMGLILKLSEENRMLCAQIRDPAHAPRIQSAAQRDPAVNDILAQMQAVADKRTSKVNRAAQPKPKKNLFTRRLSPADQSTGEIDVSNTTASGT